MGKTNTVQMRTYPDIKDFKLEIKSLCPDLRNSRAGIAEVDRRLLSLTEKLMGNKENIKQFLKKDSEIKKFRRII